MQGLQCCSNPSSPIPTHLLPPEWSHPSSNQLTQVVSLSDRELWPWCKPTLAPLDVVELHFWLGLDQRPDQVRTPAGQV
ncbi:hypothetical protein D8674_013078 [Pyrus ussuriensis x Pyrus communis]|uniref:Uncharacterized protein n=1 Tax=Pyrus ussuriensis x Pyrus communis TaxID=2448454 RepID=A0A5N5GNT4_9ROSA|nr:hypothetical protein D8674_013078 [Pyrus ussuriensis x Pyrus communis]